MSALRATWAVSEFRATNTCGCRCRRLSCILANGANRVARLRQEKFTRIAPTHFGIYDDPEWQLRAVESDLDAAEHWLEGDAAGSCRSRLCARQFSDWMNEQGLQQGLSQDESESYELANPPGMSADGLQRYWKKVRLAA